MNAANEELQNIKISIMFFTSVVLGKEGKCQFPEVKRQNSTIPF